MDFVKRLFVVMGPESSGNRLVAGILMSLGCGGSASTNQPRKREEFDDESDDVVYIAHSMTGLEHLALNCPDRELSMILTARDPWALACSNRYRGHDGLIQEQYRDAFAAASMCRNFLVLPPEALILHPDSLPLKLAEMLDLRGGEKRLVVNERHSRIYDCNARWHSDVSSPAIGDEFVWFQDRGYGWYPVRDLGVYDQSYFAKYKGYAETEMGRRLTAARLAFVRRHITDEEPVLDFGIGSGDFIEARGNTFGYDVNPAAVAWLRERELMRDPFTEPALCTTFWDSLEHVMVPEDLIPRLGSFVFVSMPIYGSADDARRSKHFRPNEHVWYFTEAGLMGYFDRLGFDVVSASRVEEQLGRESIGTYAFKRA